jgi:hypothetical protein
VGRVRKPNPGLAEVGYRRHWPVLLRPGEGPLTEPKPGVRPLGRRTAPHLSARRTFRFEWNYW